MLQFPPIICHAPTSQYIVLFVPCHSQGTHRPSRNIMLCIIWLVSIPAMVSFTEEEDLGIATERYRRDNQIPDSDGFAIIMLGSREADQRQCSPIYLINMIQIGLDMQVYQRLIGIIIYIFCTIVTWKESINCDAFDEAWKRKQYKLIAQPLSHGVLGWLISRNSPVPAPWRKLAMSPV